METCRGDHRSSERDPSHTLRMTGNSLPLEGKVDCEARRMRWHFTNLFFTDTLCPTPHHRLRQSLSSPETATLLSLRDISPIRGIASRRSISFPVILRECATEESQNQTKTKSKQGENHFVCFDILIYLVIIRLLFNEICCPHHINNCFIAVVFIQTL